MKAGLLIVLSAILAVAGLAVVAEIASQARNPWGTVDPIGGTLVSAIAAVLLVSAVLVAVQAWRIRNR